MRRRVSKFIFGAIFLTLAFALYRLTGDFNPADDNKPSKQTNVIPPKGGEQLKPRADTKVYQIQGSKHVYPANSLGEKACQILEFGTIIEGMEFFANCEFFTNFDYLLSQFARRLAEQSPEEGAVWLNGLDKGSPLIQAIASFSARLAELHQLNEVIPFREKFSDELKKNFDSGFLYGLSTRSIEESIAYAVKVANSNSHYEELINIAANNIRDTSRVYDLNSRLTTPLQADILGRALAKDYLKDPQFDFAVARLRPGQMQHVYQTVARELGLRNVTTLTKWLASLPDSPAKNSAIYSGVQTMAHKAPAAAFEWAKSINDPKLMERALSLLLRSAGAYDPQAAVEAVRSAKLPEDVKNDLLTKAGFVPAK